MRGNCEFYYFNLRYDANGQQIFERNVTDAEAVILYCQSGETLLNEMQGTMSSIYVSSLAYVCRDHDELESVQLLGAAQQGSIIKTIDENEVSWTVYEPYEYSK